VAASGAFQQVTGLCETFVNGFFDEQGRRFTGGAVDFHKAFLLEAVSKNNVLTSDGGRIRFPIAQPRLTG